MLQHIIIYVSSFTFFGSWDDQLHMQKEMRKQREMQGEL